MREEEGREGERLIKEGKGERKRNEWNRENGKGEGLRKGCE